MNKICLPHKQLSFVREHTPFLMSLASLRTPNLKLSVERERRLEIKKEKLQKLKNKLDYFTKCKCGVKYGKV